MTDVGKKAFIVKSAVLLIYGAIVFIGVLNHEYWFDEAQAWNIARDNDISGIFSMLKYEGHPPLWFLLLHILTCAGLPCESMGFLCWGLSVLSAAIILFKLPIRPYLKAAMIFCSGMLFVNSIIARPYCLINFLLCVIAAVYPKRKEHPLAFGLLIALIANTHVCMCGFAGILGVYMLVDSVVAWKSNTKRQNTFNLLGITAALAGAAFLVLPLLESLSSNNIASNNTLTFGGAVKSVLRSPLNIFINSVAPNLSGIAADIMIVFAQLCMLAAVIVWRHKKRVFIIALAFILFYVAICEIIWYDTPNRGNVFVFTLAAVFAMGCSEKYTAGKPLKKPDQSGGAILKLLYKIRCADAKPDRTVSVLLAALLALTVPSGLRYYIQDIYTQFAPSENAANFIKDNARETDLIVTYSDDASQIIAYVPARKFYSIAFNGFYSYNYHKDPTEAADYGEFCRAAADCGDIYYISRSDGYDITDIEPLYESFEYIPFVFGREQVKIWRVTAEELEKRFF